MSLNPYTKDSELYVDPQWETDEQFAERERAEQEAKQREMEEDVEAMLDEERWKLREQFMQSKFYHPVLHTGSVSFEVQFQIFLVNELLTSQSKEK